MATRVVVVGDVAVDVVVHVLEPPARDSDAAARTALTGGGAGANVAAWLAHLGVPVTLVARVGADAGGRQQLDELGGRGVDLAVRVDPAASTGTIVVLAEPDGTRTMYPDRGANLRLGATDVPVPLGAPGDHLHLSGYVLLDGAPRGAGLQALAAARSAGMTTSVDASSAAPLARAGAEAFLGWTAGVDVLRAAAAEARILAPRAADPAAAARALAERYPVAVVTDGPRGGWVARGASCHHRPAARAEVADTVGAGDAVTAGFLAAWTAGGELSAALAAGLELAARAVGSVGARPPLR